MDKTKDLVWVLHVCNKLSVGGVQAFLMNYYREMNKSKIQFAFVVQRDYSYPYDDEIIALGGRVHKITNIKNLVSYKREFEKILKDHPEYKIVHSHMHNRNAIPLLIAKKNKIPIRISHAHNTGVPMPTLTKVRFAIMKSLIQSNATHFFACTEVAGKFLHGEEIENTIIKNAIELNKFKFNNDIRRKYRKEFNIGKEYLVGHIGNFTPQKNYFRILNIFRKLPKNYKLILVGTGSEYQNVVKKIKELNITERVILTGERNDVQGILQAMDVFIFPSLFEGLGIVAIESQAVGLPTIVSTEVPQDACVTDLCQRIDLDKSDIEWVECIKGSATRNNKRERENNVNEIAEKGYDIKKASKALQRKYIELYREFRSE